MGDISEHFSRSEFACKCGCGFDTVDTQLLGYLEQIRAHFDRPVRINSGCRCNTHNTHAGGGANSQHLYGRAADIVVDGISPEIITELAIQIGAPGVGRYSTFTHIDSRSHVISRWQG